MSKNVSEVLGAAMSKVKEMVDANTVVGAPVHVSEDVTVVPISKITFGLASGGADMASKVAGGAGSFSGGAGCAVKIIPVAFMVIQGDRVRMLPIDEPASSAAERLIEQIPMLVDKVSELIQSKKEDITEI